MKKIRPGEDILLGIVWLLFEYFHFCFSHDLVGILLFNAKTNAYNSIDNQNRIIIYVYEYIYIYIEGITVHQYISLCLYTLSYIKKQ